MNKKYLLVLPLVTMALTACETGVNPYKLPDGGNAADYTEETDLEDIASLVNEGIENTLFAAQNNVKLTLSFDQAYGTYSYSWTSKHNGYDYKAGTDVVVDNLGGEISLTALGLGDEVQYVKGNVNISNLAAKGSYKEYNLESDPERTDENYENSCSVDFKGVGAKAWLNEGTVYADLTNKNLKSAAGDIYGKILDMQGEDSTGAQAFINQFAGKYSIDGLLEDELEETLISDDFIDMVMDEEIGEQFANILLEDAYGPYITFKSYPDGSIAAQATVDSEWGNDMFGWNKHYDAYSDTRTNFDYCIISDDSELTLTVIFDKQLRLSSIGLEGHLAYEKSYGSDEDEAYAWKDTQALDAYIKASIIVDWKTNTIKMPNFAEFGKLPISL